MQVNCRREVTSEDDTASRAVSRAQWLASLDQNREVGPLNEPLTGLIATSDDRLAATGDAVLSKLHGKVMHARSQEEVLQKILTERPSILILDYALPGAGGGEVCRMLRENPETTLLPIIMITPAGDGQERIQCLEAGADDCLAKPVESELLVAYIKALGRRVLLEAVKNRLRAGPIDMDLDRWTVTVSGHGVALTKKEFSLLRALLEARGRALTRDFLLQKVWSHGTIHGLDTRTVDVHIGRLRRKLGSAGRLILTVRNVGFRFDIQPEWIKSRDVP